GRTTRRIAIEQFATGAFETALRPGELLQAIRIPYPSRKARWGYVKICRKPGEFAMAIGAVLLDPDRDMVRAVIVATHGRPIVIADARELFGDVPRSGAPIPMNEATVHRQLDAVRLGRGPARRPYLTALARAVAQAEAA